MLVNGNVSRIRFYLAGDQRMNNDGHRSFLLLDTRVRFE